MIVRAVALGQVTRQHARKLIRKEIIVALINGLVWGGVMGLVAMLLYKDVALGLVMILAMTLNLILAASMGVLIPMTMIRFGRDPAVGSSVLITAVTDSGGFHLPGSRHDLPDPVAAVPSTGTRRRNILDNRLLARLLPPK